MIAIDDVRPPNRRRRSVDEICAENARLAAQNEALRRESAARISELESELNELMGVVRLLKAQLESYR